MFMHVHMFMCSYVHMHAHALWTAVGRDAVLCYAMRCYSMHAMLCYANSACATHAVLCYEVRGMRHVGDVRGVMRRFGGRIYVRCI